MLRAISYISDQPTLKKDAIFSNLFANVNIMSESSMHVKTIKISKMKNKSVKTDAILSMTLTPAGNSIALIINHV
jgi:hypothetical protein